ncbi:MAG: thioredoxin family protein [Nitrospirota bacterium]|nr:MAG: thioredoxin family protein [Nitrospirota bacterium]
MTDKRKIEIFSAECPVCKGTIDRIIEAMCPSCEVVVLDMHDEKIAERARRLGIRSVPAVVVEGRLITGGEDPVDINALKDAGLGKPL